MREQDAERVSDYFSRPGKLLRITQLVGDTMSNLVARDNRFSNGANVVVGTTWSTWEQNYLYSSLGTDGAGAAIGAP